MQGSLIHIRVGNLAEQWTWETHTKHKNTILLHLHDHNLYEAPFNNNLLLESIEYILREGLDICLFLFC